MIICLDYDGTYTAAPDLMDSIIQYCEKHNIRCILATMRYEHEKDSGLEYLETKIPVYYTGRRAKLPFLMNLGIDPSIWIDDRPEFIVSDASSVARKS